jgi:hypothetical protein
MFLDLNSDRRWKDSPQCMSCKGPVLSHHSSERLELPFDAEHKLHELSGLYHSECARPYLSMMRAMTMLSRRPF